MENSEVLKMVSRLSKATPDTEWWCAANIDDAMFGNWPTLQELREAADAETMKWLIAHLAVLSTYSGAKNMDISQLRMLALTVVTEYGLLKMTEFMLFCHRFRAGKYGEFYGNVDPLKICTALNAFIYGERMERYAAHEQEEREKRQAEDAPSMTWEEYCERNHLPKGYNPLRNLNFGA